MARSLTAGSSQSIVAPNGASINLGTGDYTVAAWVRFPTNPPNNSVIIGKRAGGFLGDEGWELIVKDGAKVTLQWFHQTDLSAEQKADAKDLPINDGVWHLLAGDHTDSGPGALRIWLDGAIAVNKSISTVGTVDTTVPMVVGAAYGTPSNTNYLTGEIGPVFVCPRLLTQAEHEALAAGFSARFLRPAPCFLMELTHRGSPEVDLGYSALHGVLENSPPIVDNPRIIYPVTAQVGFDGEEKSISTLIEGQSAVTANLTRDCSISTSISAQSTVSADLSKDVSISTTINGQSAVTATAGLARSVSAQIDGQSDVTATAGVSRGASATIAGQSALAASLAADVAISAAIVGQSILTATLTASISVLATIVGQSRIKAALRKFAERCSVYTGASLRWGKTTGGRFRP